MKYLLYTACLACCVFFAQTVSGQYLVDSEFLSNTPDSEIPNFPGVDTEYDVDAYKLVYNTVDPMGDPAIATGLVVFPSDAVCNRFPMAVYCHGTVVKKFNVPSEENTEAEAVKVMASTGVIAVAPDYLGYGESPGLHPYHHAETEARATIDLIRATREFLQMTNIRDNQEVFITGYSQGGHAAMAALKYAHENGLVDELGIVAGAPCSGAYNLSDVQIAPLIYDENTYDFMGHAAFLATAYERAYGNIYDNIDAFFQLPYADRVARYFDGMQNKYNIQDAHDSLPKTLEELLVDSVLVNLQNNDNHPLWQAFRDNDNYDWKPEVPIRMFYCSGDKQVNPQNSLIAETTMLANGAEDVEAVNSAPGINHENCVLPAFLDVFDFFSDLSTPCEFDAVSEEDLPGDIKVFPNPVQSDLTLSNIRSVVHIRIFDLDGREVTARYIEEEVKQTTLPVDALSPGMYIVKCYLEDGRMGAVKVVKQ